MIAVHMIKLKPNPRATPSPASRYRSRYSPIANILLLSRVGSIGVIRVMREFMHFCISSCMSRANLTFFTLAANFALRMRCCGEFCANFGKI